MKELQAKVISSKLSIRSVVGLGSFPEKPFYFGNSKNLTIGPVA
jgi:hypothetical protein